MCVPFFPGAKEEKPPGFQSSLMVGLWDSLRPVQPGLESEFLEDGEMWRKDKLCAIADIHCFLLAYR